MKVVGTAGDSRMGFHRLGPMDGSFAVGGGGGGSSQGSAYQRDEREDGR